VIQKVHIARTKTAKSVMIETVNSLLDIGTGAPESARYTIRGIPRHNQMSKILEPSALATAISARPCFATIIELIKSGTDVHAARIVNPMITSLTPSV